MPEYTRIGFIGAGKMAAGLAASLLNAGFRTGDQLSAADPSTDAARAWAEATGVPIADGNADVAREADVLVLAVKPQVIEEVLGELSAEVQQRHLVVSIAAGVTTARLESLLPPGTRVVRVMPNVLCLVGAAASCYCGGQHATDVDVASVGELLGAVGRAAEVPERLMDAVTGLSGSGPAFVAVVIDALADGGVRAGLPRDVALELAAQTVLGTAKLVLETGRHPAEVKDMVTSPGGTTIAGLAALEEAGLRSSLIQAVDAAARRSRELSGE